MTQGGTGIQQPASGDVLAMTSLASRQDLAARVRQLLDGVLGLFWRNLERSLATALDEFERYLIQQANKAARRRSRRTLPGVHSPHQADARRSGATFHALRWKTILRGSTGARHRSSPRRPSRLLRRCWNSSLVGSSELDESLTLQRNGLTRRSPSFGRRCMSWATVSACSPRRRRSTSNRCRSGPAQDHRCAALRRRRARSADWITASCCIRRSTASR